MSINHKAHVRALSYTGSGSGLTGIPRTALEADGPGVVINDEKGSLSKEALLSPQRGGIGIDSSGATGIPHVKKGVWSIASTFAAEDRCLTTQDASDQNLFVADSKESRVTVVRYEIIGCSDSQSCYYSGVVKFHGTSSSGISDSANIVDPGLVNTHVLVQDGKLLLRGVARQIDWRVIMVIRRL